MEHERCERQTPIEFRCRKILPGGAKTDSPIPVTHMTESEEKDDSRKSLASPTPEKPEWRIKAKGVTSFAQKEKHIPVNIRSEGDIDSSVSDSSELCAPAVSRSLKDKQIELPEKYNTLVNLFNRMESSIRLLGLLKKLPTFQNICTQVEVLSKRKLLCNHLAQMKYVFPEAIHIEKILIHDDKSLCMMPDMKITFLLDVGCSLHPDQSPSMTLCQTFHARLAEFLITHPEDADIPEAILPDPFNQRSHTVLHNTLLEGPSIEESQQDSLNPVPLSSSSHFSSSFSRQFSKRVIVPETKLTQLLASPASLVSINTDNEGKEFSKSPQRKDNACPVSAVNSPDVIYTPSRGMVSLFTDGTPAKYNSNPNEVMVETPASLTPKRPIPTPQEKLGIEVEKSVDEPKSAHSVRRSLMYSPSKSDGSVSNAAVCMIEQSKATQYPSQRSSAIKILFGEETGGSPATQLQVVNDCNMSPTAQAKQQGKQHELLAMFNTVCLISRSTDCSLITKQELVHKIISNNLDIEETREVEELLGLLEELVPGWIRKKALSSGESFYSIKKTSDPESIRARLVEAV